MIDPKQKMMHKVTPSRVETTTKIQTLLLALGPDMMRSHECHEMAFFLVFQKYRQTSEILVPTIVFCSMNSTKQTHISGRPIRFCGTLSLGEYIF
jgi:hypothetical protein